SRRGGFGWVVSRSPPVLQRLREVQRELPVLFEVDKERGESAAVRIAIEPTDKFDPSFLGKHDRVEELLRRWSRRVLTILRAVEIPRATEEHPHPVGAAALTVLHSFAH